jgi:methionyl-tRNA formyltransferase
MRLLFAGTPDVAVPSLEALLASRHDVVAVLTRPDAPSGRGRTLQPSPIAQVAHERGIEVLTPPNARDEKFLARLQEMAPDCAPIVAFGGLIPSAALDLPRMGWVNLHFSLLPAWRGAAPVQHAVLHGDEVTGACTFRLEAGLDTGPVYGSVTETIHPTDTSGDLLTRLSHSGARLLVQTLDGIEDATIQARPQSPDGISLAPKITVDDARLDFSTPALAIDRRVRACTPAPGAWTTHRDERLKVFPLSLDAATDDLVPGEIRLSRQEVRVGTGSHAVVLGDVQPAGKRRMPASDWARGARVSDGERLG